MKAGRSEYQEPKTSAMVRFGHHDRAVVHDVGPDRDGADDEQLAQELANVGRTQHRHFFAALGDVGEVAEIGPRTRGRTDAPRDPELVQVLAQAGTSIAGCSTSMAYQAIWRARHAGVADRHDAEPDGGVLATDGIGRNDVGHGDRHVGVKLQRLEARRHQHEVGRDGAMDADGRIVDRALDAELGEDDKEAGGDAGQRQQRAGPLAAELLRAQRHGRRGPGGRLRRANGKAVGHRPARAARRDVRQRQPSEEGDAGLAAEHLRHAGRVVEFDFDLHDTSVGR